MYERFYELERAPFSITPDPEFMFLSGPHERALEHLTYGITSRKGFAALTGEVGCGKTTVCRALLARMPENIRTAYVLNPMLSGTQIIRAVVSDLGLDASSTDVLDLIQLLNTYLLDETARGNNVAVIIDEAQDLVPEAMEQVRLLSNLETNEHKLLQIILAGQPELEERLNRPELRQLRQRILIRCKLKPLELAETREYVAHRLQVAGATKELSFTPAAIRMVQQYSGGIPRLINALCDYALMAGFVAESRTIGLQEVLKAMNELEATV